jgi:hypothetical protein
MRRAIRTVLLVSRIKPIEIWPTCSKILQNDSSTIEKETLVVSQGPVRRGRQKMSQGPVRRGRQKMSWRRIIEEEDKIVGNDMIYLTAIG